MTDRGTADPVGTGAFLTVGIGASAGGLEAFKSFFSGMPEKTGMAFVLVQHLSPDHVSMLAPLLDKATRLDVIEAVDGVKVEPDCVLVIPPDATMTIVGGHLKIVKPAPPRDRRRPIDTFLQSLAEDQGENAVGIILSGTGSDGSLGVAAIKERGGLTLAQAEYDHHAMAGMPLSAANTGLVDDVLEVEAMPARIFSHQRHLANVAAGKDGDGLRLDAVSHLDTILRALQTRTGYDFSEYKEKTLVRRLQRRMQVLQVETPEAYMARLTDHPEELDMLLREVLISVTQFFRDPGAFDALNETVLKGLMAAKGGGDEVRVWVPGCATGEEVYSIAILLREAMEARRPRPKVQIFGTDLDERAIAVARLGRYRKPVAGLSAERAERWFNVDGDDCCITSEIREMCIFSVHSVIKHPPFSKLDMISCRNLLIYLEPSMQDRLMRTFHYGLKAGGKLFLGSSESVTRTNNLFSVSDKKSRIFERRDVPAVALPSFSTGKPAKESAVSEIVIKPNDDRIDRSIRRLMEKHYPPHLLLDRTNRIVRFSGGTVGQYLEPSPGVATFALFDILRKALRPTARDLLQKVRSTSEPVRRDQIPIRIDDKPRLVSMVAERLADHGPDAEFVVLALHDMGSGSARGKADAAAGTENSLQSLQQELRTTRTQLQSTIDELETANEEMKSSNEEYQSVNEELQSSNEELETAKEEMQSINEELQTINVEMAGKNEQLTRLNSDIKNLLESTEIATLFLDEHLRIKSFTRGVSEIFSVRDTDIGRPITEIVSLLDYTELQRDVKTVLRKLVVTERRVTLADATMSFEMRVRPYRTIDNVIDGVVCTFVDVTAREAADVALRDSETQFHALAESIPQLAWIMDPTGNIFWYNRRWFDYTNTTLDEMKGTGWRSVHDPAELDRVVKHLDHCISNGEVWEDTFPLRGGDGAYRWFLSRAEPLRDESGKIVRWFGTNTDIEDQRRGEELRELLLNEMDHRVKNLFAIVGGVVTLSARSAKTPQEMAAIVQGRLGALASAHVLIRAGKPGSGASQVPTLDALVRAVLAPHVVLEATDGEARVVIEGPDVPIGGDAVTSLALVLHELATNAAKYGALSTPDGRVHVSWTVSTGKLELRWEERDGPPVHGPPARDGFGSLLARRSLNGQLQGDLTFDWDPLGLTVRLWAALERLVP